MPGNIYVALQYNFRSFLTLEFIIYRALQATGVI